VDVPPMKFDVDKKPWEASRNRLASSWNGSHKAVQGYRMVPGTPYEETEWRVAFHHRLQSFEQGYHQRRVADTQHERHAAAHWIA